MGKAKTGTAKSAAPSGPGCRFRQKATHFNDVKILDGTVASLDFQVGINAGDGLNVGLINSSASSLGLDQTSAEASKYTSERIASAATDMSSNPAVSDIKINGQNFSAAVIGNNASPASTEGAKTIADAVNSNTTVHGAVATAFNKVQSKAQASEFVMSDAFEINSKSITVQNSREELVAEIKKLKQVRRHGSDDVRRSEPTSPR